MPVTTPPVPAFADVLAEVLYYGGLSVPIGIGMTVAILALPEARGGLVARRVRALGPVAAVFVVITAVVHVIATMGAPGQGDTAIIQTVGYLFVIAGLVAVWKRASRSLAGMLTAAAVVTAAIPEMGLATPTVDGLARNLMTLAHVLGALSWIGGLWVLATVGLMGRRARRRDGEPPDARHGSQEWNQIWERFTTVALWAVGVLITSGSWLAWSHVGTAAQLLTTPYGRYLTVKLVLVVLMLAAGAYNVRVLMPKIVAAQRDGDEGTAVQIAVRHLPVVVAVESVLALAVLVVVPFLRGSARSEAGWPNAGGFDLSVFATGLVLVALVALSLWWGSRSTAAPSETSSVGA